jgi:hypothetical protein
MEKTALTNAERMRCLQIANHTALPERGGKPSSHDIPAKISGR